MSAVLLGFSGTPAAIAQTPGGDAEYIFGASGPGTLDRFDTATQTVQQNVYTFSDASKSVRDMRIVDAAP